MAFIYLSYPNGVYPRPDWASLLIEQGKFEFFDPGMRVLDQIGGINLTSLASIPEVILKGFGLPESLLLGPDESLLKWDTNSINKKVWLNLYFLVRSSVVIVDCNLTSLNDMALELSLAHLMKIPIVLISSGAVLPLQLQYLSTITIQPNHPDLIGLVKHFMEKR